MRELLQLLLPWGHMLVLSWSQGGGWESRICTCWGTCKETERPADILVETWQGEGGCSSQFFTRHICQILGLHRARDKKTLKEKASRSRALQWPREGTHTVHPVFSGKSWRARGKPGADADLAGLQPSLDSAELQGEWDDLSPLYLLSAGQGEPSLEEAANANWSLYNLFRCNEHLPL